MSSYSVVSHLAATQVTTPKLYHFSVWLTVMEITKIDVDYSGSDPLLNNIDNMFV